MAYEKGSLRCDDRYSPRTMHGPDQVYVPRGCSGSDFIVGGRAEVLVLAKDLLDLLVKTRTEACVYSVHPDNTLRTQDGNVIAACADRVTAALLGVLLDRFDMLSDDDGDPVPYPAWKGPYAS